MRCQIYDEESVCPKCSDMLNMNVDIGDGFLYDICGGCGFKRKKKKNGEIVEDLDLVENKRRQSNRRGDTNGR